MEITSLTNPKIKQVVKLRDQGVRRSSGTTIADGVREIGHALNAGVKFQEFFVCRDLLKKEGESLVRKLAADKAPVYDVPANVFAKISFGDRQEGVLGICSPQPRALKDLGVRRDSLLVIVEHVEKPGNLGAILRTCDAAGVTGLIACEPLTDIFNPNVIRASMGAVFTVPVVQATNEEALEFLKKNKIQPLVSSPAAKTEYTKTKLAGPVAIVLGSEDKGVSDFWLRAPGIQVKIPMRGRVDSLNVSASAAILIYAVKYQLREA